MRRSNERRFGAPAVALVLAAVGAAACSEDSPTSIGYDVLPGAPVTLQIEIPWEDFGSNLQVFGGYGLPGDLGTGLVANGYDGTLNARTLVRFGAYPASATVRDTTDTNVTDTDLTFVSGRIVAKFLPSASTPTAPVDLTLGFMDESWHRRSASWTMAVDTIGSQVAWSQPGGGTVVPLDTVAWEPAGADSIAFVLDSARVAAWEDAENRARGARLDLVTGGHRIQVTSLSMTLVARPSVNPGTLIEVPVSQTEATFVYDPLPTAPADGIRVGGAPSWRTVLDLTLPTTLDGPVELCEAVGCPVTIAPHEVSYAGLVLTTRRPETAYQPLDTLHLDARMVLSRAALPKAPLGGAVLGDLGRRMPAALFGAQEGSQVEVPITGVVRDLLSGGNPETGEPYPNTIALLTPREPLSFAYASFHGPGTAFAPVLKLVVTVGPSVELP